MLKVQRRKGHTHIGVLCWGESQIVGVGVKAKNLCKVPRDRGHLNSQIMAWAFWLPDSRKYVFLPGAHKYTIDLLVKFLLLNL
jgi:hypothetical protein